MLDQSYKNTVKVKEQEDSRDEFSYRAMTATI